MENLKIVRRSDVESITGLSRSSIYAMMASNSFPKNIKLGERSVGWLESEIQDWLTKRIAASREGVNYEQ